ncbi:cobalamin import ATP-binding protein BtuD [Candidatus Methanoplasma termitum]|uniref:BtuD4 protein n=1 Tax=Candidatus Methanoplasma termitum TaxID=1577791 RepID=A0A0A7LCG8_9ARCH|nr:ABC transporter ATP-binding protein [Candidatus Methanoplasma termitum]AIZ56678.1 cobalamin import ATP-binding protein BtuD [Candidatus Methanoplasma termitum]MCL2333322.1 ABC transporter ATP-binding protein [Candidatus Methanoplasma sp.]
MIEVKDVSFSYGSKKILDKVSFRAGENQIISVLGPNGAGKTTLLKCICGILEPSDGSILVDDISISDLKGKELAKRVAFVPQSAPVTRLSVFDSVLLGRRPHIEWTATQSDIDKVSSVIDTLGMSHLSLRYMDRISGGEFQKALIARAIVQEPKILILDEPSNNLDISNQHTTMHMVEHVVRSRGMCTIMTMHDINLAVHYSDRFLFLKEGEVVAFGGVEIITEDLIKNVYGMHAEIVYHKGVPFVVPRESSKYEHLADHRHPHDIHDHIH